MSKIRNIYLIYNNKNDKVYVGQTLKPIEDRFKEHINEAKMMRIETMPLYHAMNKHGIENFKIKLLEEVLEKQADEKERYYIKLYSSFKKGYNATIGGKNGAKRIPYSDKEIVEKYLELKSLRKTGRFFGIDHECVSYRVKNAGIELFDSHTHFGKSFKMIFPNGKTESFKSYVNGAKYLLKIKYPIRASKVDTIRRGLEKGMKKGRYYNIILSQE